MNLEQFVKLLKRIERKYGWKNHMTRYAEDKPVRLFKYATFSLDTRDMTIWQINFLLGGEKTSFSLEVKEDIKKMYEWLEGQD